MPRIYCASLVFLVAFLLVDVSRGEIGEVVPLIIDGELTNHGWLDLKIDPTNKAHWFGRDRQGMVWSTEDSGVSWRPYCRTSESSQSFFYSPFHHTFFSAEVYTIYVLENLNGTASCPVFLDASIQVYSYDHSFGLAISPSTGDIYAKPATLPFSRLDANGTWTDLMLTFNGDVPQFSSGFIFIDPADEKHWIVMTNGRIYNSMDYENENFTLIQSLLNTNIPIFFDPMDPNYVYTVSGWISSDRGQTWTFSQSRFLYSFYKILQNGAVYRYNYELLRIERTESLRDVLWTPIPESVAAEEGFNVIGFDVSEDESLIVINLNYALYVSVNGGPFQLSNTPFQMGVQAMDVASFNETLLWIIVRGWRMFRSDDAGRTWQFVFQPSDSNLRGLSNIKIFMHPTNLFPVITISTVSDYFITFDGKTWERRQCGLSGEEIMVAFSPADPSIAYFMTVGPHRIYDSGGDVSLPYPQVRMSLDSGRTFTDARLCCTLPYFSPGRGFEEYFISGCLVDPFDDEIIWITGSQYDFQTSLSKYFFSNSSYTTRRDLAPFLASTLEIYSDQNNPGGYVYRYITEGGIMISSDGNEFVPLNGPIDEGIPNYRCTSSAFRSLPGNRDVIARSCTYYSEFSYSLNGARNWTTIQNLNINGANSIGLSESFIFIPNLLYGSIKMQYDFAPTITAVSVLSETSFSLQGTDLKGTDEQLIRVRLCDTECNIITATNTSLRCETASPVHGSQLFFVTVSGLSGLKTSPPFKHILDDSAEGCAYDVAASNQKSNGGLIAAIVVPILVILLAALAVVIFIVIRKRRTRS